MCEELITCGEAVNERYPFGHTPLFAAAYRGNTDVCERLISQGAIVDSEDFRDFTPLFMAVFNEHLETCKLLVFHGSNINKNVPWNIHQCFMLPSKETLKC